MNAERGNESEKQYAKRPVLAGRKSDSKGVRFSSNPPLAAELSLLQDKTTLYAPDPCSREKTKKALGGSRAANSSLTFSEARTTSLLSYHISTFKHIYFPCLCTRGVHVGQIVRLGFEDGPNDRQKIQNGY